MGRCETREMACFRDIQHIFSCNQDHHLRHELHTFEKGWVGLGYFFSKKDIRKPTRNREREREREGRKKIRRIKTDVSDDNIHVLGCELEKRGQNFLKKQYAHPMPVLEW